MFKRLRLDKTICELEQDIFRLREKIEQQAQYESFFVTLEMFRKQIDYLREKGAGTDNLVAYFPKEQYDKFKCLMGNMLRRFPISTKKGFIGNLEFDGVPVKVDDTISRFYVKVRRTK